MDIGNTSFFVELTTKIFSTLYKRYFHFTAFFSEENSYISTKLTPMVRLETAPTGGGESVYLFVEFTKVHWFIEVIWDAADF